MLILIVTLTNDCDAKTFKLAGNFPDTQMKKVAGKGWISYLRPDQFLDHLMMIIKSTISLGELGSVIHERIRLD